MFLPFATRRSATTAIAVLATLFVVGQAGAMQRRPMLVYSPPRAPLTNLDPQAIGEVQQRLLFAHNRERALHGVAPLRWDPLLASAAATYGPTLSALGRLQHSSRANRPGQAENLWMGSRGAYPAEAMVGLWNDEKRYFRPGLFPDVSSTGNWQDVAHFTQVIWKGTTHVGCAIHRDARYDFLICRYSPKGNVDGRRVP